MAHTHALSRRDTPRRWPWLTLALILTATVLALFALPSARHDDQVGERGPAIRPQSNTRPMPPPSVARTRRLAA